MRRVVPALLLCAALVRPALADEFETALGAALDAYRAGDIALAREELGQAGLALDTMQAGALERFLPAPLAGWTRADAETETTPLAMLGGGLTASAVYRRGEEDFTVTLTADSPMVAPMAALFSNPTMMALQGDVRRAGRQRYVVDKSGDVTAMIGSRVLVQVSGSAALEDKIAHFETIDFGALVAF